MLVQFCVAWDDDAIIIGSVRHGPVIPAHNPRDTKRWRTPSGNEVALTTEGEGAAAKDIVDLHAQGQPVFQAVVDHTGQSVSVQCAGSYVHLLNKGGEMRVEVFSGGAMLLHAAGHLQIEGESIQIKAKGGGRVFSQIGNKLSAGSKTLGKPINKGKSRTPAVQGKGSRKFQCAMKYLTKAEAGYVSDSGGPTMHGITQKEYIPYRNLHHPNDPAWPDLSKHDEDMKQLTPDHAREIYQNDYWDSHCESLPMPLAMCRFDAIVQSTTVGKRSNHIAESLGLPAQASWAQINNAASQASPAEVSQAADKFLGQRLNYYVGLATGRRASEFRRYMQGWANRIGLVNPLASAEADRRSKQGYGDGLKQFIDKLDTHCKGCK